MDCFYRCQHPWYYTNLLSFYSDCSTFNLSITCFRDRTVITLDLICLIHVCRAVITLGLICLLYVCRAVMTLHLICLIIHVCRTVMTLHLICLLHVCRTVITLDLICLLYVCKAGHGNLCAFSYTNSWGQQFVTR